MRRDIHFYNEMFIQKTVNVSEQTSSNNRFHLNNTPKYSHFKMIEMLTLEELKQEVVL